jgi:hypothetical protein
VSPFFLLLYSDRLPELFNTEGAMFSYTGIKELSAQKREKTPSQWNDFTFVVLTYNGKE